jgi:hypothetical protein
VVGSLLNIFFSYPAAVLLKVKLRLKLSLHQTSFHAKMNPQLLANQLYDLSNYSLVHMTLGYSLYLIKTESLRQEQSVDS